MARLAVVVTHPVQYHAPLWRELARRHDLEVMFAHRQDKAGQATAGFGVEFEWDVPLTDGYAHRWLKNVAPKPGLQDGGTDCPELRSLITRSNFDAVLVCGWNHTCYRQAIFAAWKSGLPLLCRGDSQLPSRRSLVKRALKYIPYRVLLPRFAGHLVVGQRNRAYLRHYGVPESRFFSSPHCVDTEFFARRADEAISSGACLKLRSDWGVPDHARVLLFAGKFIPKKRPQDFVEACVRLMSSPEGESVHAVLVGDGPLGKVLESAAAPMRKRIHFAGFQNQSALPACYGAADALVLPSTPEETWGLVVNEAFACGIPAVVSDAAGCAPDLIAEGRTGFTYPCGDVQALTSALARVLELRNDSQLPESLAAKTGAHSVAAAAAGVDEALAAACLPH
jgi:glycosyltransferase involved in cell wall biosynthesis